MKKGLTLLLLLLVICNTRLAAQYYVTGQDPASLQWDQIRTRHFRVIYPRSFSAEAEKYVRLLEESYIKVSALYPDLKTNIPVIIHSYSMESNGYVSWAPRRMELYPLPGQDNLPMDPAEQLTIHETTHVFQLASLNRGISRVMSILLGEQIVGLNALTIPSWAFEGDAVYAETSLTSSGRGRSNAFLQGARALSQSPGGIYGYDKMLSGSFKDFTPDHYVFGYLMMNHLRSKNPAAWGEAMNNAARNAVSLNPVNLSLKKTTGLTKKRLYENTFDSLQYMWGEANDTVSFSNYATLNLNRGKDYICHYSPYRIDRSRIISLKTSLSDPPCFVITDTENNKEQVLTTTGYVYPYIFSYSNGMVVWSELHPDPRWDNLDYSVIKTLDISEGQIRQVTFRTRYTAPDLSPDGRTIVAVSTTPDFKYSLVFVDAFTGEKMMDVSIPGNMMIQRPAWSSDGRAVTVVTLSSDGEGIRTYYPTGKKWIINKPESLTDIIQAALDNDTLFYLAQGDGSDNIYRITSDSSFSRVTKSRFGISGFSVSDGELLISDYSSRGFNISAVSTGISFTTNEPLFPEVIPVVKDSSAPNSQEPDDQLLSAPKPYSKFLHLFNFHSWFPFYADVQKLQTDPMQIRPGFTLMSQNHLSTLITTLGYEYSQGNHYLHSQIEWRGWYPVVEAGVTYGGDQLVSKPSGITTQPSDISVDMNLNITTYLPLYFSYGKFRQLFMPAIYMNYRNRLTYISDNVPYDKGVVRFTGRLYFSNTFRTSYRDIYPRWGQVIDMRLVSTPWDKGFYGNVKYIRGTVFFPGFIHNHSLVVRAGYEDQTPTQKYLYQNINPFPRGYTLQVIGEKLLSLSVDYTMPLFYPDFNAGSIFYLKRIRSSLFLDGATGTNTRDYTADALHPLFKAGTTDFGSFGGELLADFYLLRFPFEISAGVSGGYIPSEKKGFAEGVLSVNIYGTVLGRKH